MKQMTCCRLMLTIVLFITFFSCLNFIDAKIRVMTHCFNKPEFINLQYRTLKKFLVDDYEFVVFNDAPNDKLFHETEQVCRNLNIPCYSVPQSIHVEGGRNPSVECGQTIQYMMHADGFYYPGIVVLLDSDMFPIREIEIEKMLEGYDIAAMPQYRMGDHGLITYLLPNLIIVNMPKLKDRESIDFGLGMIDGVNTDTAGFTYFYLKDHPELKWLETTCRHGFSDCNKDEIALATHYFASYPKMMALMQNTEFDYEYYNEFSFIHFRAGSNWNLMDPEKLNEKTRLIFEAMEEILK